MAGLRLNGGSAEGQHERPQVSSLRRPRPPIEISDDDTDYVQQPVRRQSRASRPGTPLPNRHRVVPRGTLTPQTLSDSEPASGSSVQFIRNSRRDNGPRKRLKLERNATDATSGSLKLKARERTPAATPSKRATLPIQDPLSVIDRRSRPLEDELPPYFADAKLDMQMYRGPGFERFPVALGTFDGHDEVCSDWDRKTARRALKLRGLETAASEDLLQQWQDRFLAATLEILPDIDQPFVREHFRAVAEQNPGLSPETISIEHLVNTILEKESYPKAPHKKQQQQPDPAADGTGVTIPVNKDKRDHHSYLADAVPLLAWQFLHIPAITIFIVVQDTRTIFDSYLKLAEMEETYFDITKTKKPYRRYKQPRQKIEKKYSRSAYNRRDDNAYPFWVNEIQAAKQHIEREAIKSNRKAENEATEARNLEEHRRNGSLVECGVCFDDETPLNRAVTCHGDDAHFFCFSCVCQLADTQVGMVKYEMMCMDGSGCKAALNPDGVGRAVPIQTINRLALNEQQAQIAAAGLAGLEQCPYCDFKAILDPVETAVVFQCLSPDCGRATCRKCHEDAHVPRTCEEVKKGRGLSARHLVEEARSASVMRSCPKGKVKIMKEHGCNKMFCTQCATVMCYVCQRDITKAGYQHFHAQGSKCLLHDLQDTNGIHAAEADAAEREAIRKAKAEDTSIDEEALQVETGKNKSSQPTPDVNRMGMPPGRPHAALLERELHAHQARVAAIRRVPEYDLHMPPFNGYQRAEPAQLAYGQPPIFQINQQADRGWWPMPVAGAEPDLDLMHLALARHRAQENLARQQRRQQPPQALNATNLNFLNNHNAGPDQNAGMWPRLQAWLPFNYNLN